MFLSIVVILKTYNSVVVNMKIPPNDTASGFFLFEEFKSLAKMDNFIDFRAHFSVFSCC